MEEFAFKPAFLLPYFNHPARIAELVHALAPIAPVLIVDDGSNEASKGALNGLAAQIYARAQNGGKGAAVCDGLVWAKELGFTHAFQIDADFQHDVGRCEEFLALAAQQPSALICAAPAYDESAPKSRLHGRKIMNFWCVVNTLSHRIKDAMCGFRIYPLKGIVPLLSRTKSRRMGFDAEILILAVRAGLEIKWLDLAVRYESGGVSHFAPFRDNFGISLMHARLFCGLPLWLAKRALRRFSSLFDDDGGHNDAIRPRNMIGAAKKYDRGAVENSRDMGAQNDLAAAREPKAKSADSGPSVQKGVKSTPVAAEESPYAVKDLDSGTTESSRDERGREDTNTAQKPIAKSERETTSSGTQAKHWSENNEKAGVALLNLARFVTLYTPDFCMRGTALCISAIYFALLKNERRAIREFLRRALDREPKIREIYANFYKFSLSLCEKIAVWNGKIALDQIRVQSGMKELLSDGTGKILITSHFGSTEIARALSASTAGIKINVLIFRKHSENFMKFIEKMGGGVKILYVGELGIGEMLQIKELLQNGEHIAIMGDRMPVGSDKFQSEDFLGRSANFPIGGYLLAKILDAPLFSLWCYEGREGRELRLQPLPAPLKSRDKARSVAPPLKCYVRQLELYAKEFPSQWYNFFDFWAQGKNANDVERDGTVNFGETSTDAASNLNGAADLNDTASSNTASNLKSTVSSDTALNLDNSNLAAAKSAAQDEKFHSGERNERV